MRLYFGTLLLVLSVMLVATGAAAQAVSVGFLGGDNVLYINSAAKTVIDHSHPANAIGSVNTATVRWVGADTPCADIFYVDFYAIPGNAFFAARVGERGPFAATNGLNTVALDPPVNVTPETYIGIRRSDGAASCGQVAGTFSRPMSQGIYTDTLFTGGNYGTLNPIDDYALQAMASSTPSVRVSTLPVVGSLPGSFGSFFRTSLSLVNQSAVESRGKLVLRVANRSGSDTDPSFDFHIPANGSLNFPDILATMGQSGLGSLDILTTGSPTPIASARVFNDTPTGTSGFTEDAVPASLLGYTVSEVLIPTDLTNFRLNIGVRTFDSATLYVTVFDAGGNYQGALMKTYDANYFTQVAATVFLEGLALPPGGRIEVQAARHEFFVYGAVTDNRTNDPSMRIGLD